VLLLGACGGGGDGSSLTMDDLRKGGDTCPVDLGGAAVAAGLTTDEGEVAVEVTEGSGDGGLDDAAIDQVGGVYVECTLTGDDGDVNAVLFASERAQAIGLVLPMLQRDLELASADLGAVVERFDDSDAGEPFDLGADDPVAAAARLDVDGAESAVLYVSAPQASPQQVQDLTDGLLDAL
jgi:hypothetical protein